MTFPKALEVKVAIVARAGQSIGLAIAQGFLEAGAQVTVCGRKQEGVDAALKSLSGHEEKLLGVAAHVGRQEDLEQLLATATDRFGTINVLVNNAAIRVSCGFEESFEALDQAWNDSMRVNAIAPAHLCRLATRHWKENDVDHGIIINLSSRPAYRGDQPHYYHDGASKAALTSLSYAIARFCAKDGVTVFTVVPGIILTGQVEGYQSHYGLESALEEIPLKEFGEPEDIAKIVTFLASGDARYATGSTIDINGASYIH